MSVNKFRAGQFKDSDLVTESEFGKFDSNNNISLTQSGNTDVVIIANTNEPAALIINDSIRYNTSNTSTTLSGTADTYSIFAIGDNSSNKNFTLDFAVLGQTPAGATNYRKVGEAEWDGSTITSLTTHDDFISSSSNSGSLPQGYLQGLKVVYNSTSSIIVKIGSCRDSDDTEDIYVKGNITVSLNSNGAAGLDTGTKANNTWYYVWVIKNTSTDAVSAIFSTSYTSPTLPNGYDKKRLLPIAIRTDGSSNILDFHVASWGEEPKILYNTGFGSASGGQTSVLSAGSSTSYSTVNCSNFIPPISTVGTLHIFVNNGSNNTSREDTFFRESSTGQEYSFATKATTSQFINGTFDLRTTTSQNIQYKAPNGSTNVSIWVAGFIVNNL